MKRFAAVALIASLHCMASTAHETAGKAVDASRRLVKVGHWHKSYVEVTTVDSSVFYSMHVDGSVTLYRPYSVDAIVNGCSGLETHTGNWCISQGRLYRYRDKLVVKAHGESQSFYLNKAGLVCSRPDVDQGNDGKCEVGGSFEGTEQFKTGLREGT